MRHGIPGPVHVWIAIANAPPATHLSVTSSKIALDTGVEKGITPQRTTRFQESHNEIH